MARTVLEIFLSSTTADLKPHREAIYARLARIEFFKVVRQEDFGAQDAAAIDYCCAKARAADLFVGLIGMRRGWEPHGDNAKRSITEMEYDTATDAARSRYLWVSPDDFPVPGNLRETDDEHQRQIAFRKRVMGGGERIVSQKGFSSPEALSSDIVEQLLAHVVTSDLIKTLRPDLAQSDIAPGQDQKPAIAAAMERLAEDKEVDLLALARNPQGVDLEELGAKLRIRAQAHEAAGIDENKISAEYWRHIGALAFLRNTQAALEAYQRATILDPQNVKGWATQGILQHRLGQLSAAQTSFETLRKLGDKYTDIWAESAACTGLGFVFESRGDLPQAEEMHALALKLDQQLGDKATIAASYTNLASVYGKRAKFDESEAMQRKALALCEALGRKEGVATAYVNLGNVYRARGNETEAVAIYHNSLKLFEEADNVDGMATVYTNLGLISHGHGNLDDAEENHRKALALSERVGAKEGIARALWNLARVFEARGDRLELCETLRRARDLCKEIGIAQRVVDLEEWIMEANCSSA